MTHSTLPPRNDGDLKQIAMSDRHHAVHLLVSRYRTALFGHAVAILKNREQATDITQEVFIKAIREERLFNVDFKIRAWLYRVTSNLCFNTLRNKRRRTALLEQRRPASFTPEQQENRVFATQRQRVIHEAMCSLPDHHRAILALRYYSDLSYNEIAEALNIKLGTVMSRLSRAKRGLSEELTRGGVVDIRTLTAAG